MKFANLVTIGALLIAGSTAFAGGVTSTQCTSLTSPPLFWADGPDLPFFSDSRVDLTLSYSCQTVQTDEPGHLAHVQNIWFHTPVTDAIYADYNFGTRLIFAVDFVSDVTVLPNNDVTLQLHHVDGSITTFTVSYQQILKMTNESAKAEYDRAHTYPVGG
jgi:hypothetical protein